MQSYGWLSLIPPIVAIGLAIKTKQVYLSLGLFILLGWTIIHAWNPVAGMIASADTLVGELGKPDNARVLMFSAMIGAMITYTQYSGGMEGFAHLIERAGFGRSRRGLQYFTALLSGTLFLESNFGLLVTGSVARPLFDKCRISREKLSYLIDATCAPKCILIPLNAWGAYVVGLLIAQEVENPIGVFLGTIPLNFYAIVAILVALTVVATNRDLGPMREAERRVREEGKVLRDGAQPMVSQEVASISAKPGVPKRPVNMILPIGVMVLTVPFVLYLTGNGDMRAGSGSQGVFWGVVVGLVVASTAYLMQRLMGVRELTEIFMKGVQGLIPLVLVLFLAYGIGTTMRALGTGVFLAQVANATLPTATVPTVIFVIACLIAFSTGTSWGTFGIMIPIVVPMIDILGLHPSLTIAAALGGGIFGDHCSPISDSTIIASMASATDHIDHVRTQLPYALLSASITVALLLVFGYLL